jgi:O-antigen/teichoic acid export membrane protein
MSVHFRLDGFLLERLHPDGATEAGIYAASYRLLDAANMVGFLFASFLLPYIARQWRNGDDINMVVLNTRHFLLLFSAGISSFIVFFAPQVQQLLYELPAGKASTVMQFCLPALLGYSLVSIYGTVMTATGHIYAFCMITFIAVLLNVTLNVLLIPSLGATACCIAALASQSASGIATLLYCRYRLGLQVHYQSLLIYTFITAVLCVFFYYGRDSISPWLLAMAGAAFVMLAAFATRLINPAKLKTLIKTQN